MAGNDRQIAVRQMVGRLETFKRHLIDLIVASEPKDTEIYAKALLLQKATDVLIDEFAAQLDYPPPPVLPSTSHYLREPETPAGTMIEDGE